MAFQTPLFFRVMLVLVGLLLIVWGVFDPK